jgi:predicted nucleic acid-binding protein
MDYCFDTSGINRLHDDPDRQAIVAILLAENRVLITSLNIIEAAVTENAERRNSLLALQRQVSSNDRPVRLPTEVLRHLTLAYVQRLPSADIAIDDSDAQFWWVLHEPERVNETIRQEAYAWKKELEKSFSESHQDARTEMRKLFSPKPPKSLGQLLQFCCNNPHSFLPTASTLYKEITGSPLEEAEMRDLFRVVPEWPLYLAGWAHGMYARAIQDQNYSPKKNPGTVDLWFAVHLAHCDVLVTDDLGQYKALRVINALGERRRGRARVLTYDQFGRHLSLSADSWHNRE